MTAKYLLLTFYNAVYRHCKGTESYYLWTVYSRSYGESLQWKDVPHPSHDIPAPADKPNLRKDWFCMADYHVFSSENWTN